MIAHGVTGGSASVADVDVGIGQHRTLVRFNQGGSGEDGMRCRRSRIEMRVGDQTRHRGLLSLDGSSSSLRPNLHADLHRASQSPVVC